MPLSDDAVRESELIMFLLNDTESVLGGEMCKRFLQKYAPPFGAQFCGLRFLETWMTHLGKLSQRSGKKKKIKKVDEQSLAV